MKVWKIELSRDAKTGRYWMNESLFFGEQWEEPKDARREDVTNWLYNYCALFGVFPENCEELAKAKTLKEIVKFYQKLVDGIKLTIWQDYDNESEKPEVIE